MWMLLRLPRFGGAEHADDHNIGLISRSRSFRFTALMLGEGVAEAGHQLDGALTVAHAVWHFAGAPSGPPQRTRAYPVAARLNPVREMGQGKSGVSSGV